jgi:tight adherence protein C
LVGIAVFIIAKVIFEEESQYKVAETLDEIENEEKPKNTNDIILKYSRPLFRRYFTPIVSGMKGKKKIKEKYRKPLASSGLTGELSEEDFFAFKLFLIIGFPLLFLALRSFLEEDWPIELTPLMSVFGFVYPDIWLKGKIERRRQEILANMPFVVDLLALSVEAGLDFMAAITRVIEKAPPSALVDEFETVIKETRLGASRSEALRNMSWRVDSLAISSFCATLIAADSVGASIGPILKTLAGEIRQKRSSMIEKKGAAAATKLLFPMLFLTLPAVVIIIFTPIVLKMISGD